MWKSMYCDYTGNYLERLLKFDGFEFQLGFYILVLTTLDISYKVMFKAKALLAVISRRVKMSITSVVC